MDMSQDQHQRYGFGARLRCRSYASSRCSSVASRPVLQAPTPEATGLPIPPVRRINRLLLGARESPAVAERFYRPELDVLRLVAFLMVWCAHATFAFHGLLPLRILALINGAGSLGVPVFFFLSAYLITELLRRERAFAGRVKLPSFYMRRILRIWPLYFGILTVYGLLGLRLHGFRVEPGRLLASVLMAGNWYIARHPHLTTPMRHLWSISVEEQWYVLWPMFFVTLRRKYLLPLSIGLFVGSQSVLAYLAGGHSPSLAATAWVNSGVQFQFLAMGAAAALLLNGRIPRSAPFTRGVLFVAAVALFLLAAGPLDIKAVAAPSALKLCCAYLSAGLGCACLFFAFLGVNARRCPYALVRLGQLSYGLYVLHETAIFLAEELVRRLGSAHNPHRSLICTSACMLLALALTAGLAFASYYAWELPFLRLKQRWTLVRSRAPG
jgi:peptidoglycan/LPS O-acetylase OafA/YrhL